MPVLNPIYKRLSDVIELGFVLRFALLLGGLYGLRLFMMGIVDPRGRIYSSFFEHYLNYLSGLRTSILQASNAFAHLLGADSSIVSRYVLRTAEGRTLFVDDSCLGYGIMSFWMAFTLAQENRWKENACWCAGGIAAIWLVNCLRIAILLLALHKHWQVNKYIDHHDLFNLVVYSLILLMLLAYYQKSKTDGEKGRSMNKLSIP